MYWFSRPPYLRYAAALLLVLIALWVELRPTGMVDHPFAAVSVPAGSPMQPGAFELRSVPSGLFEEVSIDGVARRTIPAGHPLLPADVDTAGPVIPDDWWTVEVPLPGDTQPGDEVRIVVRPSDPTESALVVDGLAVQIPPPADDLFGTDGTLGLVAVPDGAATEVAAASGERRVSVLVRRADLP